MPEDTPLARFPMPRRRRAVAPIWNVIVLSLLIGWGCGERGGDPDAPPKTAASGASQAPVSKAPVSTAPVSQATPASTGAHAGIDIDDPATCKACHAAIHAEWSESMHSRAHHAADPVFGALRSLRMKKQGAQIAGKCAQCHTPRAPQAVDSPAAKAGVSCAACHAVAAVGPGKGAKALTWDPQGVLRGAHDLPAGASPAHGTGPGLAAMKDGRTLCLACHGQLQNPAGVTMCSTGTEVGAEQPCTGCHMAQADGPGATGGQRTTHASHRFGGPHRAWLQDDISVLAAAVDVAVAATPEAVTVTLVNKSGHAFPSGFPGRMAVVQIVGLDGAGKAIWRSQPGHADGMLNSVYVDADGKPVLPPFSVRLLRDNRLKPAETRAIRFAAPKPGAKRVRVALAYHLVPPPALKVLGLEGAPEGRPKVFYSTEVEVAP